MVNGMEIRWMKGWRFLQQTREYEGVRCDPLGTRAAMMASHSCYEARWGIVRRR